MWTAYWDSTARNANQLHMRDWSYLDRLIFMSTPVCSSSYTVSQGWRFCAVGRQGGATPPVCCVAMGSLVQ